MQLQPIWIYIENGIFLEAKSFGATGTKVGEIVFNTSLTGYQEIATDPSYAGQFISFTMSEIGIVGANEDDMESRTIFAKGVLVRSYNELYSNFRGKKSFSQLLKECDSIGICDIDTRFLTKMIRDEGAKMMIASTQISDKEELKKLLEASPRIEEINYIKEVSTKQTYIHETSTWDLEKLCYKNSPKNNKKIAVIDYGVKRNILNELVNAGMDVEVYPHFVKAQELIEKYENGELGGVFLSNGPGDPLVLEEEASEIKKIISANIPIFAICLGHQLLSISHGHPTYKLKFGQHGGNHPVKNMITGQVEITAQNHNYSVPESIREVAEVTHLNLFDNTIEGVKYTNSQIISVQHHPEASPGPHESAYIFKEFEKMVKPIQHYNKG